MNRAVVIAVAVFAVVALVILAVLRMLGLQGDLALLTAGLLTGLAAGVWTRASSRKS